MSGKRTAIVAEDDEDIRESLAGILREAGYETRMARDGHEAILLLEGLRERPCVLFLDLMLPGMSGLRVLEALSRERFADLSIVVCSAAVPKEPLRGEVHRFLHKPFSVETLLAAIESPRHDRARASAGPVRSRLATFK
jgi:CheY-like chemotaxis protein